MLSVYELCSTPCGINGKTTSCFVNAVHRTISCSTPCGINGKTTFRRSRKILIASGAQRLAASTEKPQAKLEKLILRLTVLNALRHQRKNHASTDSFSPEQLGAQRLAASTEKPRSSIHRRGRIRMCSTPCGINGKTTGKAGSLPRASWKCSTPCGINGKTTYGDDQRRGLWLYVLNALRHQRKNHGNTNYGFDLSYECSTPCGINGKTTHGQTRLQQAPWRAQRLAASTEKPPLRSW